MATTKDSSISQSSIDVEVNQQARKNDSFRIPRKLKFNNQTLSMKTKPDFDEKFVHDKADNNKQNEDSTFSDKTQIYHSKKLVITIRYKDKVKNILVNVMLTNMIFLEKTNQYYIQIINLKVEITNHKVIFIQTIIFVILPKNSSI